MLVLQILGLLLLTLLGLLLIALVLPVFICIEYNANGIFVKLRVLCFTLRLLPQKEKPKKASAKKQADTKATAEGQNEAAKKAKPKRPWNFDDIMALIKGAGSGLRFFLRSIWVTKIRLFLPIYAGDADATATLYGQVHAYVGGSIATVRNVLKLKFKELTIIPDFNDNYEGKAVFSCQVGGTLLIIGIAAAYATKELLKKRGS